MAIDVSQAALISQPYSERFRVTQVREHRLNVCEWHEHWAQLAAQIDRLLQRVVRLGKMRQGRQGLLKIPFSLVIGRLRQGLLPGLSAISQGLVPAFAL